MGFVVDKVVLEQVFSEHLSFSKNRDISFCITTSYRLDDRDSIPKKARYVPLPLFDSVQTSSRGHPPSYPLDNMDYFPRGKAAGT
jgi:hypothetical protein